MNIKQTFVKISVVTVLAVAMALTGFVGSNSAHAKITCGSGGDVDCTDGGGGSSGGSGGEGTQNATGSIDGEITYDGEADCDGVKTSIISDDNLCNSASENGKLLGILIWVIRIMSVGVGIAAVGGVIYAALLYTSAAGGSEQVKKATQMFVNITIGLLIWGLSVAIVNFLVPGGVFR